MGFLPLYVIILCELNCSSADASCLLLIGDHAVSHRRCSLNNKHYLQRRTYSKCTLIPSGIEIFHQKEIHNKFSWGNFISLLLSVFLLCKGTCLHAKQTSKSQKGGGFVAERMKRDWFLKYLQLTILLIICGCFSKNYNLANAFNFCWLWKVTEINIWLPTLAV